MSRKQWYKTREDADGKPFFKTLMAPDMPDSAKALEKDGWSAKRPKEYVEPVGDLGSEATDLAAALQQAKDLEAQVTSLQEAVPLSKRHLVERVSELETMLEKESKVNADLVARLDELTAPPDDQDGD